MRSGILDGVSRAKKVYGDIKIMVTGHSMGGAMAAFCGLDLSVIIWYKLYSNMCMYFVSKIEDFDYSWFMEKRMFLWWHLDSLELEMQHLHHIIVKLYQIHLE